MKILKEDSNEIFKIGWYKGGKWKYIKVTDKTDMLAEVDDKMTISDKVTVKREK